MKGMGLRTLLRFFAVRLPPFIKNRVGAVSAAPDRSFYTYKGNFRQSASTYLKT